MPQPPKVMHLDEFDRVHGPQTLTWLPVRHTLDIRAFGTNAYVAGQAGDDVVEEHDELADPGQDPNASQQELYFVARGRATFTIDGSEHDAPAGTYVFIPDPASRRHAVAREPGTTVLSFGGPPTFQPSNWETAWLSAPRMRTDPDEARRLLREGLERDPDSPELIYNMACLEALQSNPDEALMWLRRSIERQGKFREWARADQDLESLRGDPRVVELTADDG
jgi:mannose-6-phosphate isomerase-like protein (cupin superfamily)